MKDFNSITSEINCGNTKSSPMVRTLCVFPSDPLVEYYKKGEIKLNYFNPSNIFQSVHVISFIENDVDESKVKELVGDAEFKIHSVGRINLKNIKSKLERIISLVKSINPDVIRTYNSLIQGWYAAKSAVELNIPLFLSLHTQYDYRRNLLKKTNFKKYLSLKYTEKFIEPFVLKNATKICIVFEIIKSYVISHGGKEPELLFNGVDIKRFSNSMPIDSLKQPLVLSVGNLIKEKNHECIILAMKNLDAHCLIIGKGEHKNNLLDLIKKENLENKISIIDSIPHSEIQNYYKSATIFALAFDPELEGLPMPVMEALSTGLPVVIPQPKEGFSDNLGGIVIHSERKSLEFSNHINELLNDENLRREIKMKSLEKSKDFDSKKIEQREAAIYSELIKLNDKR